ncbi:hypothetical protein SCLCIDRAFT_565733 [Scleroderma citrinum Foug A]|uniref:Uncharacterized protein n=1 Tax=Scleroderma citrinum Foug A TaxID=1036808 RepID=A0A0C2YRI7_9AGAM|nr:hypothetical protein SCLCIDRAFT_565733 [Scleroderma citrinum Foug A]
MWCTRWFLPLLLLPLPTASPYFLILFLFTLGLHARPCFYCIILLAALFLSSCYWQSFPLDARLSVPWADNITTFYEALNARAPPNLNFHELTPPIIRVADRCWCDFASGVFEPYDVQKWERDSVERAVADLEKRHKERTAGVSDETVHTATQVDGEESFSLFRSLFNGRGSSALLSTETSGALDPPDTPASSQLALPTPQPALPEVAPVLPGQLDMRPYGFNAVLDFRWSRGA